MRLPWRQVGLCVLQDVSHGRLEIRWSLRKRHTALLQKRPNLVDHRRAPGDQAITDPVNACRSG